jgi:site-specific recombinase XerD
MNNPVTSIVPTTDPVEVYLARLTAETSRTTMRIALRTMRGMVGAPLHSLTWPDMLTLKAQLRARYDSPATVNKHLSALRGVVSAARELGLVPYELELQVRDLENLKGKRLPKGRALEEPELAALFAACDVHTAIGARDAALLALLSAGLRRDEAVTLDFCDLLYLKNAVRVLGKGDKERLVPLPPGGLDQIIHWLAFRGIEDGPLLNPTYRDPPALERLSGQTVADRIAALAARAVLSKTTPHDMRRTCATTLLDKDVDIGTVALILGHASETTTRIYDRRGERRIFDAMAKLDLGLAVRPAQAPSLAEMPDAPPVPLHDEEALG